MDLVGAFKYRPRKNAALSTLGVYLKNETGMEGIRGWR